MEALSSVDVDNVVLLSEAAEPGSREPVKGERAANSSIKITITVVGAADGVVALAGEIMINHNEIVMPQSTSAQIGS